MRLLDVKVSDFLFPVVCVWGGGACACVCVRVCVCACACVRVCACVCVQGRRNRSLVRLSLDQMFGHRHVVTTEKVMCTFHIIYKAYKAMVLLN